jgi:hypothetical protein
LFQRGSSRPWELSSRVSSLAVYLGAAADAPLCAAPRLVGFSHPRSAASRRRSAGAQPSAHPLGAASKLHELRSLGEVVAIWRRSRPAVGEHP